MPFWAAIPALASAGASIYGAVKGSRDAKRANKNNPANAAMSYFQQNPQIARDIFNRYINQGNAADVNNGSHYQNIYNEYGNNTPISQGYNAMSENPMEYINKIMRGYNPSEGFKYKERKLQDVARSAAAQGGFSGTQYDQERQADMIRQLLGQDQQEWLGNVVGAQQTGLSGLERMLGGRTGALQGLANRGENQTQRGFNASQSLANALIGNQNQMAGAASWGQQQANQNRADARGNQMSSIGQFASNMPALMSAFRGMF